MFEDFMKKLINLASIFAITLILAGCNDTGDNTSDTSVTPDNSDSTSIPEDVSGGLTFDTSKEVTITFYHTMNQNLKEILVFNSLVGEIEVLAQRIEQNDILKYLF